MNKHYKKQLSIGILLSYVTIAVKLLTGILYTPLVLHSLGQSQYGVYSLCVSFIGYLTILNAGVNAAYIRFYVQEKTICEDNVDVLNGLFCKLFIILSVIGLVGGLLTSYFSPVIFGSKITPSEYDLVKKCFILLAFTIAIEVFSCVFKSFITANEEFIFGKTIDILGAILVPLLTLPLLLHGGDCTAIIRIRLFVAILVLILAVFFCRKRLKIKFAFKSVERTLLLNIAQFVGFIAIQSIMDQLNWQIDKLILARTQGTGEISIYSVGGLFNSYFLLIGGAVSGVFIAEINRLVAINNEEKLNNLFRKTSKIFTYLVCFIILSFLFFGKAFILRWAGLDYVNSYTVGWLLMAPVSLALIMGLGQDIARAKNKHQIQIIINICVCVINCLISIPLAIKWGAVGSAMGTFFAEIVICVIVQPIYYKKVLNLNVKNIFLDMQQFFPGIIIPVGFGFLLNFFGFIKNEYVSIVLHGILFTLVYVVSVFLFSMNSNERKAVVKLVKQRILL